MGKIKLVTMFRTINTNKYPPQQTSGFSYCSREMASSPLSVTYPQECVVCRKMVINTKTNSIIIEGKSYHNDCHMRSTVKNVCEEPMQKFGPSSSLNQPRMIVPNLSSMNINGYDNNNNNNNNGQPSFSNYQQLQQLQQLQQPLQQQQQVYNSNNNHKWF